LRLISAHRFGFSLCRTTAAGMNRTVLLILAIMTFLGSLPLAAHGEATFGLLAAALLLLGTGLSILVAVTPRKSLSYRTRE
jgi:hypothetical protein